MAWGNICPDVTGREFRDVVRANARNVILPGDTPIILIGSCYDIRSDIVRYVRGLKILLLCRAINTLRARATIAEEDRIQFFEVLSVEIIHGERPVRQSFNLILDGFGESFGRVLKPGARGEVQSGHLLGYL